MRRKTDVTAEDFVKALLKVISRKRQWSTALAVDIIRELDQELDK